MIKQVKLISLAAICSLVFSSCEKEAESQIVENENNPASEQLIVLNENEKDLYDDSKKAKFFFEPLKIKKYVSKGEKGNVISTEYFYENGLLSKTITNSTSKLEEGEFGVIESNSTKMYFYNSNNKIEKIVDITEQTEFDFLLEDGDLDAPDGIPDSPDDIPNDFDDIPDDFDNIPDDFDGNPDDEGPKPSLFTTRFEVENTFEYKGNIVSKITDNSTVITISNPDAIPAKSTSVTNFNVDLINRTSTVVEDVFGSTVTETRYYNRDGSLRFFESSSVDEFGRLTSNVKVVQGYTNRVLDPFIAATTDPLKPVSYNLNFYRAEKDKSPVDIELLEKDKKAKVEFDERFETSIAKYVLVNKFGFPIREVGETVSNLRSETKDEIETNSYEETFEYY